MRAEIIETGEIIDIRWAKTSRDGRGMYCYEKDGVLRLIYDSEIQILKAGGQNE